MKFLPLFILTLIIFFPDIVSAAPNPLVPCDGGPNDPCNACKFVELGNNIIGWLIGIMMVVFAVIAVSAGFGLVTSGGNPDAKTKAKSKMTNAFIGLIIVLAAWIMIDTGMKALLDSSNGELENGVVKSWGPWNKIKCTAPVTGTGPTPSAPSPSGSGLTESAVLSSLSSAGIGVIASGKCYDPKIKTCTGLAGIQQSTLDNVLDVSSACPSCSINVTAGTEVGHSNKCHQAGTCVDINCASKNCTLTQIVEIHKGAQATGAKVVYETFSCTDRDAARAMNVEAYCKSDQGYGHITGSHFSLY
ncbi:MAG: pilin [Candidatus Pacebacteria bacterium]|nr:pilin [Candidatus Paceibacterota bacterium]